jgi:lipoate-protein ligase A
VDGEAFIDLASALGREPQGEELDRALVAAFEAELGVELLPSRLTREEALRAAELRAWRYDSLAWTRDGVWGDRERRWLATAAH